MIELSFKWKDILRNVFQLLLCIPISYFIALFICVVFLTDFKVSEQPLENFKGKSIVFTDVLKGQFYHAVHNYDEAYEAVVHGLSLAPNYGNLHRDKLRYQLALLSDGQSFSHRALYKLNTGAGYDEVPKRGGYYDALASEWVAPYFLDESIAKNDHKAMAYFIKGQQAHRQGLYYYAVDYYSQAIKIAPDSALAYMFRGMVKSSQAKYKAAEKDFQKALELHPQSALLAECHATNLYLMQEFSKSLAQINQAINLAPDFHEFYLIRSAIYMRQGAFANALADLDKASALYQDKNWYSTLFRGYCHELQGNKQTAKAYYQQSIEERNIVDFIPQCEMISMVAKEIREDSILKEPFVIDSPYSLNELFEEVIQEQFNGNSGRLKDIAWTRYPTINDFHGVTRMTDGRVRINCLLNSSQVPREAVKFVIYHECLHAILGLNHDEEFYKKESLYPEAYKFRQFLDYTLHYKYDVMY